MCDIFLKANSLTSYESTVCFNHLTIDWINGTRTNSPIILIIFNYLNYTITINPSFEHQMHIDLSVYTCNLCNNNSCRSQHICVNYMHIQVSISLHP